MRIALLTNGLGFGGAERVVQALAEDLAAGGARVHVVATTRDGAVGEALRARGIPTQVLGVKSALDLGLVVRLRRWLAEHPVDILHSHLAVSDIAAAATSGGVRRVSTVHNPGVELGRTKRGLWHAALLRSHRLTAVSAAVAEPLPWPCQIIHPSLLANLDTAEPEREAARAALGLQPGTRLVLGVGRLSAVKGYDLLAAAAPRLRDAGARVALIGVGPDEARLRPHLELWGPRADAARLMAAADVFVAPSRSEGFPQAILEAMEAGRAVVATRVGGTPELVQHGVTGHLVPPESSEALAEAILALLHDRPRAERLGAAARASIRSRDLSREAMSRRYRALYEELLSESDTRAC